MTKAMYLLTVLWVGNLGWLRGMALRVFGGAYPRICDELMTSGVGWGWRHVSLII